MQPLWSIIAIFALTAPSVASSDDGSSEGVMAEQHAWIRETIARLDRANQLVLAPDKAAQHKTRYAVLLRQMSQGKRVTPTEAEELLRQADRREQAAIEQLARRFRTEVYQTFRQRRGTFTRRRAAWNRVLADWDAAGSPPEEQGRLIDWLQAAIRVSSPDSVGPLPIDPEFKIARLAPETIVFQGPIHPVIPPSFETPMPPPPLPDHNRPAIAPPSFAPPSGTETPEPHPLPPLASSTNVRRDIAERQVTRDATPVARPPFTRREATVGSPVESAVATEPPILPEPPPQTPSVSVNVEELAARTAGVNLAIRALEAELDRRGPWNSSRLRPLVDQLDSLTNRRNDLTLFHQILAEEQRPAAGRLDSPETLIAQVATRIFEARNRATQSDFMGSEPQRQAELHQLDELSRKLALVASRR